MVHKLPCHPVLAHERAEQRDARQGQEGEQRQAGRDAKEVAEAGHRGRADAPADQEHQRAMPTRSATRP